MTADTNPPAPNPSNTNPPPAPNPPAPNPPDASGALLATLTVRELRRLTKGELTDLARSSGVSEDGKRAVLLARLVAAKRGGAEHHVHGQTLCPLCRKGFCRVTHTADTYRRYKCRACGYTFKRSRGNG